MHFNLQIHESDGGWQQISVRVNDKACGTLVFTCVEARRFCQAVAEGVPATGGMFSAENYERLRFEEKDDD